MSIVGIIRKIISLFVKPNITYANVVTVQSGELLNNRLALITGGTSGIGMAIGDAYLKEGCDVAITGRNEEKLKSVVKCLTEKHPERKIYGLQLDNTDVKSFETKVSEVEAYFSKNIDILVNNAGVGGGDIHKLKEDDYDAVMNTNLKGCFFLSKIISDRMKVNHVKGNILNVASSSSLRPATSAYIISKWGVKGVTIGLAKILIKDNIVVNGIAPGPTATPMMFPNGSDNIYLPNNPSKRYAMPEEIANMAVFLVSDMGRLIVGDIVYMTGGAGTITVDDIPY